MTSISLSQDAMTVLGLAGTALPFAQSVDEEVERWLRPLRLYGKAGASLQAVGVGEDQPVAEPEAVRAVDDAALAATTPQETLRLVTAQASQIAAQRGAGTVGTLDILVAVMRHYGAAFERALGRRASDSDELMQHVAAYASAAA